MTKEISIRNECVALVDDEDYDMLVTHKWRLDSWGYPLTGTKNTRMHRFILPKKDGFEIDHINKNKLDNRKSNLRYATRSQNEANKNSKNPSSGFRGVWYDKRAKAYKASLSKKHLGWFKTAEEAAKAYDKEAKEKFGEFANTNF